MRLSPTTPPQRVDDPELLLAMDDLELVAHGVVEGFLEGLHRSPFIGLSVEFDNHRPYQPGDDVRHVNWKLWARQDRLYLKQYNADTNLNLYLLLDGSGSMACANGPATKWRYATRAAAALAYLALSGRDAAGLTILDEAVRHHVPAKVRSEQFQSIVAVLSSAQPGGKTGIGKSMEEAMRGCGRRGLVVLFSDLFDREAEVLSGLDHVRYHGHEVLLVHVLDPWEKDLPKEGQFRFQDMETRKWIVADAASIRDAYRRKLDDWAGMLRRECEDRGIDWLACTTADPLRDLLVDYLYKRAKSW